MLGDWEKTKRETIGVLFVYPRFSPIFFGISQHCGICFRWKFASSVAILHKIVHK